MEKILRRRYFSLRTPIGLINCGILCDEIQGGFLKRINEDICTRFEALESKRDGELKHPDADVSFTFN